MGDGGKGSAPRPFSVPKETFDSNWEKTFRKDRKEDTQLKELEKKSNDSNSN